MPGIPYTSPVTPPPRPTAGKPPSSPQGKLVLVIGPSGVGKSVILRGLRKKHPELVFPRSATTRPRRRGEGDDLYRFLSEEEFDACLKNGAFIEWATVHGGPPDPRPIRTSSGRANGIVRGGARYGTLKEEILPAIEAGKTVVREVDVQGFQSIRGDPLFSGPAPRYRLVSIFILPESREQLIERIRRRAPIAEDELGRRIASMDRELAMAPLCTVSILNREGQLDRTIGELEKYVGI